MNMKKLTSEEVPQEFLKWLLSMGCPADVVPSLDKMHLLCRGQYNMIWKSMMEHIFAQNVVKEKRLQVFIDAISKCKNRSQLNETTLSPIEPISLTLWKQKMEGNNKLLEIETRIGQAHHELMILDKVSSLLTQKKLSHLKVENLQRRTWLLQQVLTELEAKKKYLEETKDIAKSLCNINASEDPESKLKTCMAIIKQSRTSQNNKLFVSTHETNSEDTLESLAKIRGDVLWKHFNEQRASLVQELEIAHNRKKENAAKDTDKVEALVSHTLRVQSSLALQSIKNRQHTKNAQKQLASSLELLGETMSAESCELLVLNCERACAEGKVSALKELAHELKHSRGVFASHEAATDDGRSTTRLVASADADLESLRNDVTKLLAALEATEHKMNSAKACLTAVFEAVHAGSARGQCEGVQFNFPPESAASLHKFFAERRQREAGRHDLSLEFDVSETSTDHRSRSDELRTYLDAFDLEKNRKILLKNGGKVWISDTLKWSTARLQEQWLLEDVTPLLSPAVSVQCSLQQVAGAVADVRGLAAIARALTSEEAPGGPGLEIGDPSEAADVHNDALKKRIAENLGILERSKKNLEIAEENLNFWARDEMKKCISTKRTIDDKTLADFESFFSKGVGTK